MVSVGIVLAVLAMIVDWGAVANGADRLEALAKPLVMIALMLAVAFSDPPPAGVAVLIALALAAAGDVLLLPAVDRFVPGVLAFVGTHLAYLVAFFAEGVTPFLLVAGAAVAIPCSVGLGRPIVAGAAERDDRLGHAVVTYVVVLSAMWAAAIGVGVALAIAGATLFVVSDAVLGWNRFVAPLARGRLSTHVPYHLGQVLLAGWILAV